MSETIAEQFDYWYNERKASVQANMSRSEFIAGLAQFTDPLEARIAELKEELREEETWNGVLEETDDKIYEKQVKEIATLREALDKIYELLSKEPNMTPEISLEVGEIIGKALKASEEQ